MNPVLILTMNNLQLTQRCIDSIRAQDIPTRIIVIDNGSTDGTQEWLSGEKDILSCLKRVNEGVSKGWNEGLELLFYGSVRRLHFHLTAEVSDHCLVLNNDVVLPSWFYRKLLSCEGPFVTGVAIDTMPLNEPVIGPLTPHPDFSAFMIRKECWDRVGAFDESMVLYSSDQDYHLRAHFAGVFLGKANVEYFHVNSQTLKRSDPATRAQIHARANADREVLKAKWGVSAGGPDYCALFTEENFGSKRVPVAV